MTPDQIGMCLGLLILALAILAEQWPRIHGAWLRWRWPKWSKQKQAGYMLLKQVDGSPVMRKHGKYEIVEMKDVEAKTK